MTAPARRPDYGIDAPRVLAGYVVAGVIALGLGLIAVTAGGRGAGWVVLRQGIWGGPLLFLGAAGHLWSSRVGKLRAAGRMLDGVPWRGDERVLDVGCGRGLLAVEAARRLSTGRAVGVDIWSVRDQSGNSPEAARANAETAGVADRVEIRDGDARDLPFADGSFDVVVSSAVIHNIHDRGDRRGALREMVRVLAPGGRVALLDIAHTREYARELREAGMAAVARRSAGALWGFPVWVVRATKPGAA